MPNNISRLTTPATNSDLKWIPARVVGLAKPNACPTTLATPLTAPAKTLSPASRNQSILDFQVQVYEFLFPIEQ